MERKFAGEVTYPVFQREREEGVALLAFPGFGPFVLAMAVE
jgi:hypothetical protein